jgi:predicted ArsR family transcriptional regulator
MSRPRKKYHLPVWIRDPKFKLLNRSQKDLLGYLYWFGPDTYWLWNWRLAKKFGVTKRTIRRWLRKLKEQGFIWIEKPFGPERKIHVRLLPTPEHWVQLIGTRALSSGRPKHKRPRGARRGFPPPLHEYSSPASIEQFRLNVINELVHRGSTPETAAKAADQVIAKSRKKDVTEGGHKCPP